MPSRQSRSILDHVVDVPFHSCQVDITLELIVRAEGVERAGLDAFQHGRNRLLRRPRAIPSGVAVLSTR